jgi:hypothetical protein
VDLCDGFDVDDDAAELSHKHNVFEFLVAQVVDVLVWPDAVDVHGN